MNINSIDAFIKLREQLNSLISQIEDLITRLAFKEAEAMIQVINEEYYGLNEKWTLKFANLMNKYIKKWHEEDYLP